MANDSITGTDAQTPNTQAANTQTGVGQIGGITESSFNRSGSDAVAAAKSGFQSLKDEAQGLAGTAKTAALNAAATGKDRAAEALGEAASFIANAAQTLDDKIGNGVGDYARKAGTAATDLADALKSKNIDELVDDAKTAVRKNPAVAIGVAAAVGFLLTRVFRLGGNSGNDRA